jgi:hypothetical protein
MHLPSHTQEANTALHADSDTNCPPAWQADEAHIFRDEFRTTGYAGLGADIRIDDDDGENNCRGPNAAESHHHRFYSTITMEAGQFFNLVRVFGGTGGRQAKWRRSS